MGVPPGRITETGTHPACLTDGMPHSATLVSVFCIPPSNNSTVRRGRPARTGSRRAHGRGPAPPV